uniref:lipopolysaccharide biosynthesis protein n=1 Tax=Roseburia sp. TaxID=2049040 RepID=UPI003FED950F
MKVNQLKAGTLLSYVSIIISNVISIIYTPIMLRVMGQNEYGLYGYVSSIVTNLSILSFGFGGAYIRYYSRYKKEEDKKGLAGLNGLFIIVFSVIGLVALILGGLICLFPEQILGSKLTAAEMGEAKILLVIMVVNIAVNFPLSVFNSYVTASEKFLYQRLLRIVSKIMNPLITLPLLYMGGGAISVAGVMLGISLFLGITDFFVATKKFGMEISFKYADFSLMKEVMPFTFFIFINMIVEQINWAIDKFIIGRFYGTAMVAIYTIGANLNAYYREFSTSISSVFTPRINKLVATESGDGELTALLTKVGRIQFIFLSLVLTGFILFGEYFVIAWAGGEEYREAYYVAMILMIPMTVPLCQNIAIEIQRAKNRHQFRALVYLVIALFNLAITLYLCPKYGVIGSALGTSIAVVVGHIFIMNWFYHCRLGLNMKYYWSNIFHIVPAILIPVAFGIGMNLAVETTNVAIFLVKIIVYTAVYVGSMWFLGFNAYEKQLVSGMFTGFIRKKQR